jgi:hypothetical protein
MKREEAVSEMARKSNKNTVPSRRRFVTINQMADQTGMSRPFIRKTLASDNCPWDVARFGRAIRIEVESFERWLQSNTTPAQVA